MKIHEYQAKELLKQYNIPVPESKLALSAEEAINIANNITGIPCVIKAQVHSGARGKAGGIKFARTINEVKQAADQIIGMELSSIQTAGEVKKVRKVLVEGAALIDKEYYLSLVLDRSEECITIIASTEGGMDIEEIAQKTPELIFKVNVDVKTGLEQEKIAKLAENLGLNNDFTTLLANLYRLFIEKDCSLVEINPLVKTKDNKIIALDAKINFDDNALYRNQDIAALRDIEEENPLEVEASKYNLNYIKLNGTVGCMVNGAGLAMATMDIVKLAGAEPANFLDVGGGASSQNIENAFKLLMSDKNVNLVFINIFGGILRCDILAEGIKSAVTSLNVSIPVIVRLEGTNAEIGKKILNESGLKFIVCDSLNDAVTLIMDALEVKI
ncbi:MAG: ADP-forming succinate--CoA ligase subunit beta [Candidatus Gastranaerophilales bacterium]|nr:ADP-forming succinate--CoA ligase subunit beta [Candidatus Gastranaerophilales bacterium]